MLEIGKTQDIISVAEKLSDLGVHVVFTDTCCKDYDFAQDLAGDTDE